MEQQRFDGSMWEGPRHIRLLDEDGMRVLLLDGRPYMSWPAEDDLSPRLAIAQLCQTGLASRDEVGKGLSDQHQVGAEVSTGLW